MPWEGVIDATLETSKDMKKIENFKILDEDEEHQEKSA